MSDRWNDARSGAPEPDVELAAVLQVIDPASRDANYWFRFREWVLRSAGPELARRRLVAELTVGDVLTSWARAVVPTAVLAATLAGILLLRGSVTQAQPPLRLEELLLAGIEGLTAPPALREAGSAVQFAEDSF